MAFKHTLKRWRTKNGLTQVQAHKKLKVSYWSLLSWEYGRNKPLPKTKARLMRVMGVSTILLCLIMAGCCVGKPKPKHPVSKIILADQPPDPPCAPNCPTNTITPQEWPLPPYTNGELACRIIYDNLVSVTNTSPYKEYALQFSPDLFTWSTITGTNIGFGGELLYAVDTTNSQGFFRAVDVTGDDLITYPTFGATNTVNGSGCPGNYVGYWVYRPVESAFPFEPIGTNHVVIDPTGSTNTRAWLVGRFADQHCGSMPLSMSAPDPFYSLTVFFKTTMAGTNYPIVMKGFRVRTDL